MSIKIILLIPLFILNLWANERLVSLSPSITEIIYALGKGDSLVATSSYSLYPKEAQKLPIIGGYENPHIEKILSYSPSLVIGQTFNASSLQKLQHFGVETLMLDLKTIDSIKTSISTLAKRTHSNKDKKLLKNIDKALQDAHKIHTNKKVMIVYGLHTDLRSGIYIAGHSIFFDEIINECGATNAYTSNSTKQPVLGYENVIALNPDVIIILHSHATESNIDEEKALKAWQKIPTTASKTGEIHIIDEDYLHIPSHRIALTIEKLCGVIND